jgi:hypothetical protein
MGRSGAEVANGGDAKVVAASCVAGDPNLVLTRVACSCESALEMDAHEQELMSDLRFVVLKNYNGTPVGMRRWCCIR